MGGTHRTRGLAPAALAIFVLACGDDEPRADERDPNESAPDARAPMDAAIDARAERPDDSLDARARLDASRDAQGDAAPDPAEAQRAHGEYLVRHVAGCMECHTPRLRSGKLDEARLLAGVENLFDVEPEHPDRGQIHSRNLTPDPRNGLGTWSDDEIKRAFQQGIDNTDKVLHWTMPYWIYRNMRDEDADAIVAFLRSIPAIEAAPPDDQPHAVDLQEPYEPYVLPLDRLPRSTLASDHPSRASADRGFYLASAVSPCLFCHTPESDSALEPLDIERAFSGKRAFVPALLGAAVDAVVDTGEPLPTIDSWNLTPHANGIGSWSAQNIARALRFGVGVDELPVCEPMPSTSFGSFRGMSERDALDLGSYFTSIAPEDSGPIERCCAACHGGVTPDAGMPMDTGVSPLP